MPTVFKKPINNLTTTLAAAYAVGSGTMAVRAGDGARFGTISAASPIRFACVKSGVIQNNGQIGDLSGISIYTATGIAGDVLSGVAVSEGTTDQPFAVNDFLCVIPTAGTFEEIHQAINTLEANIADNPQIATNTANIAANTTAINDHIADKANPHAVTAAQVGASIAQWNASSIQGKPVATTAPSGGQVPIFNATSGQWEPGTVASDPNAVLKPYAAPLDPLTHVACWGDSLTAGNYVQDPTKPLSGGWPYQALTLDPTRWYYNGGVGGETSAQIESRMLAATDKHPWDTVIWAGRNDIADAAADTAAIKANIAAMVAALGHNRYVVLSILCGSGETIGTPVHDLILQLNNDLAATYPNNYLDIRALLVAQYNPNDPQDVTDHTNDITPSSLRTDSLHLNDAGYQYVAEQVIAWLNAHVTITDSPVTSASLPVLFASPFTIGETTPTRATFTIATADYFVGDGSNLTFGRELRTNGDYSRFTGLQADGLRGFQLLQQPTGLTLFTVTADGFATTATAWTVTADNKFAVNIPFEAFGDATFSAVPTAPGYKASGPFAQNTLMQDTLIGFRQVLNNDGHLHYQTSTDGFTGADSYFDVSNGSLVIHPFGGALTVKSTTATFTGAITASGGISGNGAGLTALNPANISAGTAGINISGNAATATTAGHATTADSATTATSANSATTATTAGNGLPLGGTAGQILGKTDAADYNAEWIDLPASAGGSGDFLSTLTSAPVSITGATALDATAFGKMHVCSGTTANYAVTLPDPTGATGKLIGFRMAPGAALTKLVTLSQHATDTIDGAATRVMWASEVAILLCDGTNWFKVAGKSIPTQVLMRRHADATLNTATETKVFLDTIDSDNTGLMADTTNGRVNVLRPGAYNVNGGVLLGGSPTGGMGQDTNSESIIRINNIDAKSAAVSNLAGGYPAPAAIYTPALAAGDVVELYGYQESGATARFYPDNCTLNVVELPTW